MGILLILKEWWYLFSHGYSVDTEGVVVCFHMNIMLILKERWCLFSHGYRVDIEGVVVSVFT